MLLTDNDHADRPPRTLAQSLAALLRAVGERIDPVTISPPSVREIRQHQAYDVEIALLDAEAEAERCRHTVAMLRERLGRLQQ